MTKNDSYTNHRKNDKNTVVGVGNVVQVVRHGRTVIVLLLLSARTMRRRLRRRNMCGEDETCRRLRTRNALVFWQVPRYLCVSLRP